MLFVLCFEASILDTVYCAIRRTIYDIAVSSWRHDSWLLTNEIREDRVVVRAEVDSRGILWLFFIVDIRGHASDYAYFGNMHILRLLDYAYLRMAWLCILWKYAYLGIAWLCISPKYAYLTHIGVTIRAVLLLVCMKYWFCSCVPLRSK
jgi:hypothetical protein